jgi:hypothetical protein
MVSHPRNWQLLLLLDHLLHPIGLITFFLTLKSLNDQYNWEEKLEDYKMFRKAKFMLNMRKLGKQAKSLNQT